MEDADRTRLAIWLVEGERLRDPIKATVEDYGQESIQVIVQIYG